jgi:hypothetical protein
MLPWASGQPPPGAEVCGSSAPAFLVLFGALLGGVCLPLHLLFLFEYILLDFIYYATNSISGQTA